MKFALSHVSGACAALVLCLGATGPAQAQGYPPSGTLLISEFRASGLAGPQDEFIEIYNPGSTAHTVSAFDGSAGYAVAASDGVIRFVIPNGTEIPARGHYLGVNSNQYSLIS